MRQLCFIIIIVFVFDKNITRKYSMSNVVVGYSPNDFLYIDATNRGIMPSEQQCASLNPYDQTWDVSCVQFFSDFSGNCIRKELCKNKEKAIYLQDVQHGHSGVAEKYMNEKMNYDNVLMNTINLGIGILFLVIIIYKNQK